MTRQRPRHSLAATTAREWSAYCDGVEDGIAQGYARAVADTVADLRQASTALLPIWPAVVRAHDAREYRTRHAARLATTHDEDPAMRRRRVLASWGLPTDTTHPTHGAAA